MSSLQNLGGSIGWEVGRESLLHECVQEVLLAY